MSDDNKRALPSGTELDGKYVIGDVLGSGGFGIVYLARHRLLDTDVAIKEYLPQEIAVRELLAVHPMSRQVMEDYQLGLQRFMQEARQLVRFSEHDNIVRCLNYFEANGTAYLVMQFEDGLPLSELMNRREQQGRPMSQAEVLSIIKPLLSGLAYVHGHDVLHRDIKPGNIFIRRSDEQPVLLDFGAAKEDFSKHSKSRAAHTPGYAATEQVEDDGKLGPWTDIYAIGAVLWRAMMGCPPAKVESRMMALHRKLPDPARLTMAQTPQGFTSGYIDLVNHCMALDEDQRPQSVAALLALMADLDQASDSSASDATSEQQAKATSSTEPKPVRGGNIETTLTLDSILAAEGGKRRVTLTIPPRSGEKSPTEKSYDVVLRAGLSEGEVIRLKGQGYAGHNGGKAGDLLVRINITESQPQPQPEVLPTQRGLFGKLIHGDYGLPRTYWLFGVLVGLLFNLIYTLIESAVEVAEFRYASIFAVFSLQTVYSLILIIGLWRAAKRYAGPVIWAWLARVIVVVTVAFTLVGYVYFLNKANGQWPDHWSDAGRSVLDRLTSGVSPDTELQAQQYFYEAVQTWYWYEPNSMTAYDLYAEADYRGHPWAKAEMAKLLWLGSEVAQDKELALRYLGDALPALQQAANQGDAHANYLLGWFNGSTTLLQNASPDRAYSYYMKAAEAGSPLAMTNIGFIYQTGSGRPVNETLAADWAQRAASQSYPRALTNLGIYFRDGFGVRQDFTEALRLFTLASNQHEPEAIFSLGQMHEKGQGVEPDITKAITYYQRAMDAGYDKALDSLRRLGQL
ncbi:MAG: hypothetical protein CVV16_03285 [Gammaproteobacteria bacterium HGW-Gammaproteobacteria-6]|nr:MAG: hypothetical protein CVV16_03285 [Gammaproteobacteria bacterium HGW-Gammaproteobacteria-6]